MGLKAFGIYRLRDKLIEKSQLGKSFCLLERLLTHDVFAFLHPILIEVNAGRRGVCKRQNGSPKGPQIHLKKKTSKQTHSPKRKLYLRYYYSSYYYSLDQHTSSKGLRLVRVSCHYFLLATF